MQDILRLLARDVEMAIRIALAERLADDSTAPHDLILLLADDRIEVARPLILRSPLLTDAELLRMIGECGTPSRGRRRPRQYRRACHRRARQARRRAGAGRAGAQRHRQDLPERLRGAGREVAPHREPAGPAGAPPGPAARARHADVRMGVGRAEELHRAQLQDGAGEARAGAGPGGAGRQKRARAAALAARRRRAEARREARAIGTAQGRVPAARAAPGPGRPLRPRLRQAARRSARRDAAQALRDGAEAGRPRLPQPWASTAASSPPSSIFRARPAACARCFRPWSWPRSRAPSRASPNRAP